MSRHAPLKPLWHPVAWPAWIAIGIGWCLSRLPLPWIFALGRLLGTAFYYLVASRRRIVRINLRLCFPSLDPEATEALLRENFRHTASGVLEALLPWLNPARDLSPHIDVIGAEHYHNARAQGRGVLVLAAHFTVMDVISAPLGRLGGFDVMYRYNKNPAWQWLQITGRQRYFEGVVEREEIRLALKRLRAGRAIWYAIDQDYGRKHSVFAPFFGVPAATIVATSRFARLNHSPVLFMTTSRDLVRQRWSITFHPVISDFPGTNDQEDASRLNAHIESFIREQPAQYLWMHRRFKTRPDDERGFYSKS